MSRFETVLTQRAEFYLCLARAFLPSTEERAGRGFTAFLADDLQELNAHLGYPLAPHLDAFRASLQEIPDPLTLLQVYSRLFLAPPVPVHLNAGWYLDGAYLGTSVAEIEAFYRRRGLARSPDFHDTPDHLSSALEFAAFVFATAAQCDPGRESDAGTLLDEAAGFLNAYVHRWLPDFCAALEQAVVKHGLPEPYLHLARIAQTAVAQDVARLRPAMPADAQGAAAAGEVRPDAEQRACRVCRAAFAPVKSVREIAQVLQRQGLSTTHLDVCPECRAGEMGLKAMTLPALGRPH